MKFEEALKNLKEGKKIRRKNNCGWFAFNNGTLLRYDLSSSRVGELVRGDDSFSLADVLADDWEVVEEKNKNKWWEPKVNEQYFFIRSTGIVDYNSCANDKVDKLFQSFGNCFQTEEQAEFMAEKLRVIHELEKFAFENNVGETKWSTYDLNKYTIIFNHKSHKLEIDVWTISQDNPFNVFFTSKELAKQAIETIGENRIKKYYFGVNENGRK